MTGSLGAEFGLNRLPIDGSYSFCETPEWLCGLERV